MFGGFAQTSASIFETNPESVPISETNQNSVNLFPFFTFPLQCNIGSAVSTLVNGCHNSILPADWYSGPTALLQRAPSSARKIQFIRKSEELQLLSSVTPYLPGPGNYDGKVLRFSIVISFVIVFVIIIAFRSNVSEVTSLCWAHSLMVVSVFVIAHKMFVILFVRLNIF